MKTMHKLLLLTALILFTGAAGAFAQKGAKAARHPRAHAKVRATRGPKKVVVVKRSPYRPKKVVVYRPVWGPKYRIHRRWVFFPRYNFYWDNWRNCYMFWNGTVWITHTSPPPVVVNVNLENEKHYELKESDDDTDDIYKTNDGHKSEYKTE